MTSLYRVYFLTNISDDKEAETLKEWAGYDLVISYDITVQGNELVKQVQDLLDIRME